MAGLPPVQKQNEFSDYELTMNNEKDRGSGFSEDLLHLGSHVDGLVITPSNSRLVQEESASTASEAAKDRTSVQGTTAARYTPSLPVVATPSSDPSGNLRPASEIDASQQQQQHDVDSGPPDYLTAVSDKSRQVSSADSPGEKQNASTLYCFNNNNNPSQGWRGPCSSFEQGRKNLWPSTRKSRLRTYWLIVLVLVTVIVLMSRVAHSAFSINSESSDINVANGGDNNRLSSSLERPGPKHDCHVGTANLKMTTSFSNLYGDFSVLEAIEHRSQGPQAITGEINIQLGSEAQVDDIEVEMYISVTPGWEIRNIRFFKSENTLELLYPDLKQTTQFNGGGSMFLEIVVKIQPGFSLDIVSIETNHCSIYALEGLFKEPSETSTDIDGFYLNERAQLSTIAGSIHLESWASRETYIDSRSGSVQGNLDLLDILSITTISGSVDVNVSPKEADKDIPRPATLEITTRSGSIRAINPISGTIPTREYRTLIETISGEIRGSYILGTQATFTSQSGALHFDLLPFDSNVDDFHTNTVSGSHHIRLLSPHDWRSSNVDASDNITARRTRISALDSSHRSVSGSLRIEYPREWEGTIDAETMTGSIDVRGKDVIGGGRTSGLTTFKRFLGHKGDGNSNMLLRTCVGSINVLAGDEY